MTTGSLTAVCRALAVVAAFLPAVLFGRSSADQGQVAISVARWLEQFHYTRQKLDAPMSQKFLNTYLTSLDNSKLYFLQSDVDEFTKKYGATLGDSVLAGNLAPAREIFGRFKERVEDRMTRNKAAVEKEFPFDSNRVVELNRQDAPWPRDEADANRIWQARIEADLLKEQLSEKNTSASPSKDTKAPREKAEEAVDAEAQAVQIPVRTPKEIVARRYDQILRNVREMDDEDVVSSFLTALAQTYDPHSEYFSPAALENFQISMKLSLVGVGAVLSSEDGYAKIKEVVPGGPADQDGRLKVNDRIAAVAQGSEPFEDVVDMKLDKVVEKIRGKKGTTVRLLVVPADATDPAKRKIVDIVRDEVKLKEQAAKAEILDLQNGNGQPTRIGWITLPSFYSSMDDQGTPKSTTEDVAALISRLKKEGIQGLVIDLRRDGGGSLEEAINLTGLFIPRGPVVQAKDPNGKITVSQDTDPGVAYSGPMVVVMNRLSASASEIFAGALQDYGRALIVGDERSFGKGTVQTVLKLGQLMPFFSLGNSGADANKSGALKLTIQKFYRVKGGSTQFKGVESDIVLPSITDNPELGEGSLKNCLPYDEVASVKIMDSAAAPLFIEEVKARSAQRVAKDPEFAYTIEDMRRLDERLKANTLSLNEKERRAELAADKERTERRDNERAARGAALEAKAFEVTLDDVTAPKLRSVAFDKVEKADLLEEEPVEENGKKPAGPKPDPIRNESLRIMRDLIDLNRQGRTASVPNPASTQP